MEDTPRPTTSPNTVEPCGRPSLARPPDSLVGCMVGGWCIKEATFSYARLGRARAHRARQAGKDADAVVAALRGATDLLARYQLTAVVLFGSLAAGRGGPESDTDLLVEGLDETRFFSLKSELEERLGRDVDLHTMVERPAFVERARRTGNTVYEGERKGEHDAE